MRRFPWESKVWEVSSKALKATRDGDAYWVRVEILPAALVQQVWDLLAEELTLSGEHLLEGGSYFKRYSETVLEVVSGGQDVLDSLSWSINVTLVEALEKLVKEGAAAPSLVRAFDEGLLD